MSRKISPVEDLTVGSGSVGNNVKLHRGATGLQIVADTDATADGVDSVAASKLSSTGLSIPSDPSFNVSIPSNNNVTVTAGTLHLGGSGDEVLLASNLSVSLLTGVSLSGVATGGALGSPAVSTAYYLYLDTSAIGLLTTNGTTGRRVYTAVVGTSLVILPTPPDQANLSRFVYLASIKTDGSSNYTSAGLSSASYKSVYQNAANSNPKVYSLAKQAVSAVGTTGQIIQGHALDSRSFPPTSLIPNGNRLWYPLSANVNDASGNGVTLTNNAAVTFGGVGILGSNTASVYSGSNYLSTTNGVGVWNVAAQPLSIGLWAFHASWLPPTGNFQFIITSQGTGATGWAIGITGQGIVRFVGNIAATNGNVIYEVPHTFGANTWHHFGLVIDALGNLKGYIDGRLVVSEFMNAPPAASGNPLLQIGAINTGSSNFVGRIEEVFVTGGSGATVFTDEDMRKAAAYRLDHAKGVQTANQAWTANVYTASTGVVAQDNGTWLVDKSDANSLYMDFVDLASGDQVELALADTGFSANNLPLMRYDSGLLSAAPTFPIAHGLGEIPTHIVIQYEVSTNEFEIYPSQGFISATATNLIGSLAALTISGSNRVRIMAFVGANAAAVSTVSSSGLANKTQTTASFSVPAGEVRFWPGDMDIQTGHVVDVAGTLIVEGSITGPGSLTGAGTVRNLNNPPVAQNGLPGIIGNAFQDISTMGTKRLALAFSVSQTAINATITVGDSDASVFPLSGLTAQNFKLNNTFKGGKLIRVVNANAVPGVGVTPVVYTIQANDASTICTLYPGMSAELMPLIDSPAVAADWLQLAPLVSPWYQMGPVTITAVTTNPTKGTVSADRGVWRRDGAEIRYTYAYRQTVAGSAGSGTYLWALPLTLSLDTNVLENTGGNTNRAVIGTAYAAPGGATAAVGTASMFDTTHIYIAYMDPTSGTTVATAVGSASFASLSNTNTEYGFNVTVPISGWTALRG